jgi:hypothetical protein
MNADKNQYCSLSTVAQAVKPAEPRFISAFLRVVSETEQYCAKKSNNPFSFISVYRRSSSVHRRLVSSCF